ncbi:hypothetical protein GQ53DRAFT_351301 [Thozetella sp. PMI_491]|nr:hypothetical protein GQ53DRAFT_351301 [Thozetella sp. PMI_491]
MCVLDFVCLPASLWPLHSSSVDAALQLSSPHPTITASSTEWVASLYSSRVRTVPLAEEQRPKSFAAPWGHVGGGGHLDCCCYGTVLEIEGTVSITGSGSLQPRLSPLPGDSAGRLGEFRSRVSTVPPQRVRRSAVRDTTGGAPKPRLAIEIGGGAPVS